MSSKHLFLAQYGDEHHIDDALENHPYDQEVSENVARNTSLKPRHYGDVVRSGAASALLQNHSVSDSYVDKLSRSTTPEYRAAAVDSGRLSSSRVDELTNDHQYLPRSAALRHTKNPDIIHSEIEKGSGYIGWNQHLTPEHIARGIHTGALSGVYSVALHMRTPKFKNFTETQRNNISNAMLLKGDSEASREFVRQNADHIHPDHLKDFLAKGHADKTVVENALWRREQMK